MLDLDGDGLELVRASPDLLFDHNADRVRTAMGWLSADDGILVRDLNGNGRIDSGQEMFGDQTPKSTGGSTRDGFEALSALDSNRDGQFTVADATWNQVQVWRDLNQNGVSEAAELVSLDSLGIQRIGVEGVTSAEPLIIAGNVVVQTASFTRIDISAAAGTVERTVSQVNLDQDSFHREFMDPVAVSDTARTLPQMRGSGMVRDLREAASLSPALAASLAAFAAAPTRDAQMALLDRVLDDWGQTSTYWATRTENLGLPVLGFEAVGARTEEVRQRIWVLEVFNGQRVYERPQEFGSSRSDGSLPGGGAWTSRETGGVIGVIPPAAQVALLDRAYEALRASVYAGLVAQTRLRPYLDSIELTLDASQGIRFDTSAMAAMFEARRSTDARGAMLDLVDLVRHAQPTLQATGFDGFGMLRQWVGALAEDAPLRSELAALDVQWPSLGTTGTAGTADGDIYLGETEADVFGGDAGGGNGADVLQGREGDDTLAGDAGKDMLHGSSGNDALDGGRGNDLLSGDEGNDRLFGGAGIDQLSGGAGDDVLDGGAGNDTLTGGDGSDTYLFGRGSGSDVLYNGNENDNGSTGSRAVDTVQFGAGVAPSEVVALRVVDDLLLTIAGTDDRLLLSSYFHSGAVDGIAFADGQRWSVDTVKAMLLLPTDDDDVITAYATDDALHGAAGDDTLSGAEGDDRLDGGAGDDRLAGNEGSDNFVFGRGSGSDTVVDFDASHDSVRFAEGVAPDDLRFERRGDDLRIRILDFSDRLTLERYFPSEGPAPETLSAEFLESEARTVNFAGLMIQAMAGFAPEGSAGTTFSSASANGPLPYQLAVSAI